MIGRENVERRARETAAASLLGVTLQPAGRCPGGAGELFRFRFGAASSDRAEDGVFPLHLEPLGERLDEVWQVAGPVSAGELGDLHFTESRFHLAAQLRMELPARRPIEDIAYLAYRRLVEFVQRRGYPHLLRVWNLFPDINQGDGDGERYRQFSVGRALALDALGYREGALPAGTAIGSERGTPLTISLLAGKAVCRAVENPRQTSAWRYPRQFGPRSPSFSRSVLLDGGSARPLLVSGTASIVGHESLHAESLAGQFAETFRNLRALRKRALSQLDGARAAGVAPAASLRVYLRRREDLPAAKALLPSVAVERLIVLRGDICRRELMIEVEGAWFL